MVADAVVGVGLDVVTGGVAEGSPSADAARPRRRENSQLLTARVEVGFGRRGFERVHDLGRIGREHRFRWSAAMKSDRLVAHGRNVSPRAGATSLRGDSAERFEWRTGTIGTVTRPTTLILVRHAVTAETGPKLSGRKPGIDLSDLGNEQAKSAGARLAELPLTAIYASPIERTQQTAAYIAAHHDVPVTVLDGVIEAEYGDWTGATIAELAKTDLWKTVQRTPSRARFPNGESIAEMQTRMVSALETVVERHPGELVVVVSHADPIKAAIAHFTGVHLDLFQRINVSPASITVFALGPHGAMLMKCNDTGSLTELIPSPDAAAEEAASGTEKETVEDLEAAPA